MPKPEDIYTGTSVYFKNGRFLYEATNVGVDFEFHNDGLVANTRHSTESADGFLTDVMNWLKEQLGLQYRADIVQKRIYRSELIVSINPKLDAIAEKLKRFSELVSNVTTKPSLVTGVLFGSQEIPAAFYIERRAASVPLERNHYIANAWMQTAQHLEMLNRFESIMAE